MPTEQDIEVLRNLIDLARTPETLRDGAKPFVLLPPGTSMTAVDQFLPNPTRKIGSPTFLRADSFCDYVNQQKLTESRLYVVSATSLIAVMDHHGESAGWGQHRATLNLTQTPEWMLWKSKNSQQMQQRDFAQFIEDNSDDLLEPTGSDLITLVRTLKTSTNLECTGEIEDDGYQKSQGFKIQTKTKAGAKGELELPQGFTLAISPYEGGELVHVPARLRLRVDAPRLWLHYELVRIDRIERLVLETIVAGVAEKIGMAAWFGQP